jgi:hypothetical protein
MAGFQNEMYESGLSDDDDEGGQEVSAWLEEEDLEDEEPITPKNIPILQPKIDIIHKSKYIIENLDLFYALCELEDWEFAKHPDELQEEIMKMLVVEEYKPGQAIIVEGDTGNDFYIVVSTEENAAVAEVEVVNQNILAGTEVFLTRLSRGQFFGQKFFVTRRVVRYFHMIMEIVFIFKSTLFCICRISAVLQYAFHMIHQLVSKSLDCLLNISKNGRVFAIFFS